ncbi:hypothetical protein GCM10009844_26920 [Nocardioides koreensis]|uniref:Uncharacterized protein n=1 Tax=Nocardioides koreensis TaxID=433651 RepID=A0ABP5LP09_9ACTN
MIRQFLFGVVGCLALTLSGCAIGASDTSSTESGESHLAPTFRPERGKHRQHAKQHSPKATAHASAKTTAHPDPATGGKQGEPSAAGATSPAAPTTSATAPAPAGSASTADSRGDVSGLGAPAYVDLTGATVTRAGDRFRVRIDVAAPMPSSQGDDRTMNVGCFVDTDGDGRVDYEMWASLSESGWGTSYRYPDGARFGGSSGVTVTVSGASLTLGFPAGHVGGATSFRWATGAEFGTLEQVASGTTAQDLAPDDGAADFPGR